MREGRAVRLGAAVEPPAIPERAAISGMTAVPGRVVGFVSDEWDVFDSMASGSMRFAGVGIPVLDSLAANGSWKLGLPSWPTEV